MTSLVVGYVYLYLVIEILLDVGAVCFAYRLTTITGAFRGWLLMIAAVILVTFQVGASSLVKSVLFSPEQMLEASVQQVGLPALAYGSIIGMAISATLFSAMFELNRTFERLRK